MKKYCALSSITHQSFKLITWQLTDFGNGTWILICSFSTPLIPWLFVNQNSVLWIFLFVGCWNHSETFLENKTDRLKTRITTVSHGSSYSLFFAVFLLSQTLNLILICEDSCLKLQVNFLRRNSCQNETVEARKLPHLEAGFKVSLKKRKRLPTFILELILCFSAINRVWLTLDWTTGASLNYFSPRSLS